MRAAGAIAPGTASPSVDQVELFSRLEAHGLARRDRDLGSGARIASDSGFARPYIEHAKAAQLDAFPSRQRLLQALKDCVDCGLGLVARKAGPLDDPVHDVLLDQGILQEIGSTSALSGLNAAGPVPALSSSIVPY